MRAVLLFVLAVPIWADITRSPSAAGGTTCSGHPCTLAVTCPASTCTATDIQNAINEAQLGDTVTIQAGVSWTVSSTMRLYRKTSGSGLLTIRTSSDDSVLPAPGTRITAAYRALLPELQLRNPNASIFQVEQTSNAVENYNFVGLWFSSAEGLDSTGTMIGLWTPTSNPEVIKTITGASNTAPITLTLNSTSGLSAGDHVIVAGLVGNTAANGWWTISNVTSTTVTLDGSTGNGEYLKGATSTSLTKIAQWDASQTPNNITFDRCLFLGAPLSGIRQAVRAAGRNITIKESYCDHIKAQADAQCVSMPSTPGPVTITNNFLGGGSGETIITGGAIPNLAGPEGTGQNATDLTITHNAFYKDPALYKYEKWSPESWVRKGKVIDGGNSYRYIATTSGVTGASAPDFPASACAAPPVCSGGCCVADGGVTWQRNFFVNSAKWTFKNLLEFKSGDRITVKWNTFDGAWVDGQSGAPLLINCGMQGFIGLARCEHIEIAHNFFRNTPTFISVNSSQDYGDGLVTDVNIHDNLVRGFKGAAGNPIIRTAGRNAIPPYFSGLRIVHNTIERSSDTNYFWVAGSGPGKYDSPVVTDNLFDMSGAAYPLVCFVCPSFEARKLALDNMTQGTYTFRNNVLAGENLFSWPKDNYDTSWEAIGFNNRAKGDYRLQNPSPYRRAGTDGMDVGADTAQLPSIENLTVTANDRLALFEWNVTAPIENIPCVIEVSPDRDLSTIIDDLNPTLFPRPERSDHARLPLQGLLRRLIVGANAPLSSNTTYWYRLHCGGALEHGSFTTRSPLRGNGVLSISKRPIEGSSGFELEWGSSYSSATDSISEGGTSQAVCGDENVCAVTFEMPAGSIVYYRIRERDGNGEPTTSPVAVRVVQGQEQ